jgi:hypothetical protein
MTAFRGGKIWGRPVTQEISGTRATGSVSRITVGEDN